MNFHIGIKSDPILHRYSYPWLFEFMLNNDVHYLQLGSFFELYSLELDYFRELRASAEEYDVSISSCFTAHRELGGFFAGNKYFEKVAKVNYKRFIDVASVLGASYVGSNPGAVFRDRPDSKRPGIECYLENMKYLMAYAFEKGLRGLTIEPMSCSFEPPSLPEEIRFMMDTLSDYHSAHADTVPVYLCGDISHGVRDQSGRTVADNESLFEGAIGSMCEFHFKNTDSMYNHTFGFSLAEPDRGIVTLERVRRCVFDNSALWPVDPVIGYLEINGPKVGRDYLDYLLEGQLQESVDALKAVFRRSPDMK